LEERFLRILTPGRRAIARGTDKAAIEYEYEGLFESFHNG